MSISRFGSERIVRAAFEYAREHGRSKVTAAHQANIFFFQAEDGIRDIGVTGVQTCALPISKNFLKKIQKVLKKFKKF